jgi:phosphomannomutase
MPAPAADALHHLQNYVVERKYDLGIATDGDADRLGVIDDTGRYLHPNDILVLMYYYLLHNKKQHGPVVRNISTTHRLDRLAKRYGEVCYEVPVGFKYISAKMAQTHAILGGESSGGLTVAGHINGKDGVYAASLLIEMRAVTGKRLSELLEMVNRECGECYMEERSFRFTQEEKEKLTQRLFEKKELPEMSPYEIERVSYEDGCKVYLKGDSWISARFSGTEPLIRIFCEMPTKEEASKLCDRWKTYFELR